MEERSWLLRNGDRDSMRGMDTETESVGGRLNASKERKRERKGGRGTEILMRLIK
jgi:hypothetical protein